LPRGTAIMPRLANDCMSSWKKCSRIRPLQFDALQGLQAITFISRVITRASVFLPFNNVRRAGPTPVGTLSVSKL
jgi:hypothetical protein